jgi:hypothetical protein
MWGHIGQRGGFAWTAGSDAALVLAAGMASAAMTAAVSRSGPPGPAASGRIVPGLKIVEQARMGGLPGEPLAGQCTGGWLVKTEDVAEEAEVLRWDDLGRQTGVLISEGAQIAFTSQRSPASGGRS